MTGGISLVDIARLLRRRMGFIAAIVVVPVVAAFIWTTRFAVPVYRATATIYSLKEGGGALAALAQASPIDPAMLGLTTGIASSNSVRLVSILESEWLRHEVSRDLRLLEAYTTEAWERERDRAQRNPRVLPLEEIALALTHHNPNVVVANAKGGRLGIATMTEAELRGALDRVAPGLGDGLGYSSDDVRQAWYESLSRTMGEIAEGISVSMTDVDTITITVECRGDRELPAAIGNQLVSRLDDYVTTHTLTQARRAREFALTQLTATGARLAAAEEALEAYKVEQGIVSLPDQARAAAAAAAETRERLGAARLSLETLGRTGVAAASPLFRQAWHIVDLLEARARASDLGDLDSFTSRAGVVDYPAIETTYRALARELTMQETLHTLMAQQLAWAEASEAREEQAFEVLDRAQPAARRTRPRLIVNLAAAVAFGMVGAAFCVVLLEAMSHQSSAEARGLAQGNLPPDG
jgi:uncharacterized protein involved in exopolysaccharide biosynthesis